MRRLGGGRERQLELDGGDECKKAAPQTGGLYFSIASGARGDAALAICAPAAYLPIVSQFDDIAADFAFIDDWDERYKYLIDIGRSLPEYPAEKRDEAHKVKGCASQVWLAHEIDASGPSPVLTFRGDSDAHIVKGLVALLMALYSGRTPEEVLALDLHARLAPLDLESHLTPQRSNGLAAMAARIRSIAEATQSRA